MFDFRKAMEAAGRDMWFELGLSGGDDRLAIAYDRNRFDALAGPEELSSVGGSRPPLWMKLVERDTNLAFNVVVNHLNRGDADLRRSQAKALREWADSTSEPTIILGDFNFDLKVPDWNAGTLNGNRAFHIFTRSPGPALWVQHTPQMTTQCSDTYESVLDFVFVAGAARSWGAEAELLFTTDQYCTDEKKGGADHRPIAVTFSPDAAAATLSRDEILDQIRSLQEQLKTLEDAIKNN